MTRGRRAARRVRRLILIAGSIYSLAAFAWMILPFFSSLPTGGWDAMGFLGTPLTYGFGEQDETSYAVTLGIVVGLLLLAQWAFLRPGRAWTARLAAAGRRPLKSAVIAAAAMAMLLSVGLIALLLELPNWWEGLLWGEDSWGTSRSFSERAGRASILYLAMLALWGVWAWVFFVYWRQGDRYTRMGKMIRGLVAGSFAEAFVAVPVHVWATRQRECYCYRGTYTTLVLAGTVLLWAFGPGIVLLYMRERYRRARLFPKCGECGYDLRGSSDVCPECGTHIPPAARSGAEGAVTL